MAEENKLKRTQRLFAIFLIWLAILFFVNTLYSSFNKTLKDIQYVKDEMAKQNQLAQQQKKIQEDLDYKKSQVYISAKALLNLGYTESSAKVYFIKNIEEYEEPLELKTELLFNTEQKVVKSNLELWWEIFSN